MNILDRKERGPSLRTFQFLESLSILFYPLKFLLSFKDFKEEKAFARGFWDKVTQGLPPVYWGSVSLLEQAWLWLQKFVQTLYLPLCFFVKSVLEIHLGY